MRGRDRKIRADNKRRAPLPNFRGLEAAVNLLNILAIMGIALFVISMVRDCGGVMSGGCGMGSRSVDQRRPHDQQEGADMKQSPEPVGTRR